MAVIQFHETNHQYEKKNLVGDKHGNDTYKCKLCGLTVTRRGLGNSLSSNKYSREEMMTCPKAEKIPAGSEIMIINCNGQGTAFGNIKRDSVHKIIDTPVGEKYTARGYWVMGVGEPILVLTSECTLISVKLEVDKPEVKFEEPKGNSARKVGDMHKNGLWVWTEYKQGKFDWRAKK